MLRINNIKITFYPTTFQPIPKLFYYRPSTFIQTTKKDIRFIFLLNRNIQYGTNLIVKLKIMFNCIYFIKSYNHVKLFPKFWKIFITTLLASSSEDKVKMR